MKTLNRTLFTILFILLFSIWNISSGDTLQNLQSNDLESNENCMSTKLTKDNENAQRRVLQLII